MLQEVAGGKGCLLREELEGDVAGGGVENAGGGGLGFEVVEGGHFEGEEKTCKLMSPEKCLVVEVVEFVVMLPPAANLQNLSAGLIGRRKSPDHMSPEWNKFLPSKASIIECSRLLPRGVIFCEGIRILQSLL